MSSKPVNIIQITDCHLGESSGETILSMNPDNSLADVLSLIKQNHDDIDLVLATGDLSNDGSESSYARLNQTLLKQLDAPFVWLPGNHDKPEHMAKVATAPNQRVIVLEHWVILMLDSHVDGQIYGHLSADELSFMQDTLREHSDKHAMICLHHQPVPIGSQWMDNYIVRNAQDFWQLLEGYSQLKLVVWGHVHQEFADSYKDIGLLAAPSTCIQFTPGQKDFAVEDAMPGYRWFRLHSDGRYETGVERTPEKDYGIDFQSSGY